MKHYLIAEEVYIRFPLNVATRIIQRPDYYARLKICCTARDGKKYLVTGKTGNLYELEQINA